MNQLLVSEQAALQVIQEAVRVLAVWTDSKLKDKLPRLIAPGDNEDVVKTSVEEAQKLLCWNSKNQPRALRLLFDSINLSKNKPNKEKNSHQKYYCQPCSIADRDPQIPYPVAEKPHSDDFNKLKREIKEVLDKLDDDKELDNLSLLTLILEKYGSFMSFGDGDVALIDIARTTAAVAAVFASNPHGDRLALIAGDLSGIQKFIYTISSDGALKSLRARSFFLELVTEEVVQQLLGALKLPRTNVIYAGGGNLYILAPAIESVESSVQKVRQQFNKWLVHKFQGKVFLALDSLDFPTKDITTAKFAEHWSELASKKLAVQKSRKFAENISEVLQERESYQPCKVCHRDDVKQEKLQPLNDSELDSVLACETCCTMYDLGGKLLRVNSIVRSHTKNLYDQKTPKISFELSAIGESPAINVYYYLFEAEKPIIKNPETVLLINNWTIEHYKLRYFSNPVPLLLGNYGKEAEKSEEEAEKSEESGFMRANQMAKKAKGINRVGYLRMDVDNLGRIFAEGLGENKTLPRITGLSRQMSYFFKVYLNSLAEFRETNTPEIQQLFPREKRLNLLFIYAGGDDLFVSGAWNEVVEFAFDVYQCFRAYTGYNPNMTISGGISIDDVKFPLYQAAKTSGEAEDKAKANGRDSLALFGQVFKWDEWLGIGDINIIDDQIQKFLQSESKPKLLGILPFVKRLEQQNIGVNYLRNFVRNLLLTAQIQEHSLKKFEANNKSDEALGTRYYLHLPKIAYTLARLPKDVLDDVDFRTSLKSPYNAPYFRAIATWIELLNR
ncbi:type III-A CRISPR-associated protein Cas10/Csm1 [Aetokthonos hydrillicola Thurmond2011]|jgi:CRISPR-associated protein Csm1|uniref:CRISPR system single-strand-specific deoxyribonuclease Cas10/Csm1 (subtype III-A) n=1 Tax=Aetokthonos hydrillicola Thurmond2011 TaxID=2712845 RepID=A0AAP5M6J6_9CYAN|nr:type III-A CRISPR-associated protein Cas10/Csm1 [Aetokthonos hydrillicola]MBO3463293.1 type III-A CRISPR-associated protein Cas10/Csm1 [Aetokthonos hydrillicola CCALA 1050]MBW4591246.1 type III-A CRISPR-associated protein Cas10/Csm1 [Aetokthonos hydrillicola CCALA 1050]MDR9897081.1 type III-A CRISPR-associated protein Cas10/Csm1 [Aetokthonos hydrillicola Thurmond2011]